MEVIDLRAALGRQIRKWREDRHLSQDALAKECGVDKQSIWRLENGRVWPEFDNIQAICKALDVPDYVLFTDPTAATNEDPQLEELIRAFRRLDKRDRAHAVALLKALGGSDFENDSLDASAKASGPGKK